MTIKKTCPKAGSFFQRAHLVKLAMTAVQIAMIAEEYDMGVEIKPGFAQAIPDPSQIPIQILDHCIVAGIVPRLASHSFNRRYVGTQLNLSRSMLASKRLRSHIWIMGRLHRQDREERLVITGFSLRAALVDMLDQ